MAASILYPFLTTDNNQSSYFKTLRLANDLDAEVICFTTVNDDKELDDAYLHLLNLNGQFQTKINNWRPTTIKTNASIKIGLFTEELATYLNKKDIDFLVIRSKDKILKEGFLNKNIHPLNHAPKVITLDD